MAESSAFKIPQEGVGTRTKVFVFILTVVTLLVGMALMFKIVKKFISPSRENFQMESTILPLAEKLEGAGLSQQAIAQYQKALKALPLNRQKKAEISFKVATLYNAKGNCQQAVEWYFKTQIMAPEFARQNQVDSLIQPCLTRLK